MKKLLFLMMVVFMGMSFHSCAQESLVTDVIVSSFEDLTVTEIEEFTAYDDGRMLGDAYYVTGTLGKKIESVNYYKDEYIYFSLVFSNDDSRNGILIQEVIIEYCDYKKDIFFSARAYANEDYYHNQSVTYDELFDAFEQLSIDQMRLVLRSLELL